MMFKFIYFLFNFKNQFFFIIFHLALVHITPLFLAVQEQNIEIIKLLLDRPEINVNIARI